MLASLAFAVLLDGGNLPAAASPKQQAETVVAIADYKFAPDAIVVKAGSTIVWRNDDDDAHSIVDGTPAIRSGVFEKGETFKARVDKPGTIVYRCGLHPFMKGTITVVP
jgi:plastocyanin